MGKYMEMNVKRVAYLKVDSRNRVSLTKIVKKLFPLYRAYQEGNKIVLEPIKEIPKEAEWLFEPENKEILRKLQKSLKQKADIDLGSFKKYLDS